MAGMAFGASARKLGVKIRQSTPVASLLQNAQGSTAVMVLHTEQ